jgi:ubiquinone/menaquinone biosynthesis C-methylase UbiE
MMIFTLEEEFQEYKDQIRGRLLKYTRKAFQMLPKISNSRILDIGCGSGVPTMELAKLCNAEITAIDLDQAALNRLVGKINKAGIGTRIKVENRSMLGLDFADASFDIIWAEGSINVIGFEKGLKQWYRFLKIGGFLVVHDALGDLKMKQKQISDCGYELIDHFVLDEDIWREEYYAPLEKKINEMRKKAAGYKNINAILNNDQHEIDALKREPESYRSAFFIMVKN